MAHANAATRISKIRYLGNETTKESLLLQEMYISEGDVVDFKKIEDSVQGIMDLGLYRNVSYYLEADYISVEDDEDMVELVIIVEEKYYMLVLPRIRVEDNDLRLGVQLRWDNLHGLNHAIRLTTERMGEREGVTEYRTRFRYKYPRFLGSSYDMEVKFIDENYVEENFNQVLQNRIEDTAELSFLKWLNPEGKRQGYFLKFAVSNVGRQYEDIVSEVIVDEAEAVSLRTEYGYKKVHEHLYNRSGKRYGYKIEVSDERLGSTSEYVKHDLYYRSYYRFKNRPDDNLNVQTVLGHSTDDVLGDRAYTLDYRNDLRGYDRDRFQGNTMFLINTEYLHSFGRYPNLRYLYFLDLGNTYDQIEDMFHSPLHIGIGVGIRWKIPAFVRLDIRLDFGYGVTDRDWLTSFGTRYMF